MFDRFVNGVVFSDGKEIRVGELPWHAHPVFSGVFLKNILTNEDTGNVFTCHLVRIEPNCMIGMHTHADSMELHEVLGGSGVCVTEHDETEYVPGRLGLLAAHCAHEVRAGDKGLYLFAKFMAVPR